MTIVKQVNKFRSLKYWVLSVLWAMQINAEELILVAGLDKPPYVIATENDGFEIELMRQVLARIDHDISMVYVPFGRTHDTMRKIDADIGLTLSPKVGVAADELSLPYVTYQNVAFSLHESSLSIKSIEDLRHFSLGAFQNANKLLGGQFAQAAALSPLYLEIPQQRRQVELLLAGKVQVVVADINIFHHFATLITGNLSMKQFDHHYLFAPNHYRALIPDPMLRNAFNQALQAYLASEQYTALIRKYNFQHPAKK